MPDIWTVSGVAIHLSGTRCTFQGTVEFDAPFLSGEILSGGIQSGVLNSGAIDPPPPHHVGYAYDFGPVPGVPPASGFVKVSESQVYSPGGFGWIGRDYLARDRGFPVGISQDFVCAPDMRFRVDGLPQGNYQATMYFCDVAAPHDVAVHVQDNPPEQLLISGGIQTVLWRPFTLNSGYFQLRVDGKGGIDVNGVLNGLEIRKVS